jgi:hypothetical protein
MLLDSGSSLCTPQGGIKKNPAGTGMTSNELIRASIVDINPCGNIIAGLSPPPHCDEINTSPRLTY